ncbi:unnamed protein product [Macrosiphum euphorbiae]|uniref:Uncharacterized protein n=1 Tax=Macrosiphum euphorbiae TaxID=13131 RepID=A0AAV0WHE8_9HEMI|nr:unnamed protein product [Macrosiphum euphorbiae]
MPKKCVICHKGTEGVPTFIVTLKRKENWEFVVPFPLFVGDRICQTHFRSNECFTSEADLTNIKSRGWLKHPNKYLYELLSVVEDELMNHLGKTSVFEDTVEALITKCETFTFPCGEHKDFIIAYIMKYYINMRMRQWTRQTN